MMKKAKLKAESVETNPLKRAEALLKEFKAQADTSILSVNSAVDREAHDAAVEAAIPVCRRSYAFGYALSQIARNTLYRVSDKPLRELKIQSRSMLIPPAALSDEALEVLEVLKATLPLPKVFEGEAEYRQWLKDNGMHEVMDEDEYRSQTAQRSKFPSTD